jgi:tetratricopeptide (TPR) repeat protein
MTAGSQRAALDAIHSARPIIARLSMARDSEDLAADLIEAWTATETGLRSLIGGSALTGQMLIRELRQRHFLSLDQANALAEFHAARERASRVDYTPTEGDVNASREAFVKLEAGLMGDATAAAPAAAPADASAAPAAASSAAAVRPKAAAYTPDGPLDPSARERFEGTPTAVPPERARSSWIAPAIGLLALLAVGGIAWYAIAGRNRGNSSLASGVTAYREGRREAAAGDFMKAAKDDPNDPMPHVYLARMAREAGNMNTANTEAVTAVRLGPTNGPALRELASVSFAQQNYDAARRFYIRAVQADSSDKLAQGFLGCSLVRLGRIDEGLRWINRAGPGAWSGCAPQPGSPAGAQPGMQPGMQAVPPSGALPPR